MKKRLIIKMVLGGVAGVTSGLAGWWLEEQYEPIKRIIVEAIMEIKKQA